MRFRELISENVDSSEIKNEVMNLLLMAQARGLSKIPIQALTKSLAKYSIDADHDTIGVLLKDLPLGADVEGEFITINGTSPDMEDDFDTNIDDFDMQDDEFNDEGDGQYQNQDFDNFAPTDPVGDAATRQAKKGLGK